MRELTDDTGPDEAPREEEQQWNFPPTLDDFNLMECEEDPARLEEIFADKRYGTCIHTHTHTHTHIHTHTHTRTHTHVHTHAHHLVTRDHCILTTK